MTTTKNPLIKKISDLVKVPTSRLPRRLSATIRVALADLAKAERSEKFTINMGTWFSKWTPKTPCQVCFGGAVMAGTLRCSTTILGRGEGRELGPNDFKPAVARKLYALNSVRGYAVERAVKDFYGTDSSKAVQFEGDGGHYEITKDLDYSSYDGDPDRWRENMNKIADRLEARGL